MLRVMEPRRKRLQQRHPLRQWRERVGVNQQELAAACGLSQSMISLIESGLRVPLDDILAALLDYTGLPAEAFMLPERFLATNPDFLRKYGGKPKGRGDKK
jgi:transcriptional regulator with XRE-family HTH domain